MTKDDALKYLISKRTKVSKKIDSEMTVFENSGEFTSSDAVWFGRLAEYDILDYLVKLLEELSVNKYKRKYYSIKTILSPDTREHFFQTKEDAEKFVKDFLEVFPEDKQTIGDPQLVSKEPKEIFFEIPNPYAWLENQQILKKERENDETHKRSK